MNSENTLVIKKDNQDVTCEIYFSFVSDDTNRGYIGFTDHSKDDNGNEIIMVKAYNPDEGTDNLFDITDEKEWNMVNEVIAKVQKIA